ncbi:hypothetical protein K443DRAFT_217564 [Laccaria amethystina LaAM-08-1]|uniref:Uncharacterized protein n=1 Tax=Laccaria amethystina LaAM-08-1 TaxID=1095629 RepID=A0A0C9YA78_9AGAR|nr:hypothetical protein K443DRAFT_217564 [Laccaria amethystina LaAM-08-1]
MDELVHGEGKVSIYRLPSSLEERWSGKFPIKLHGVYLLCEKDEIGIFSTPDGDSKACSSICAQPFFSSSCPSPLFLDAEFRSCGSTCRASIIKGTEKCLSGTSWPRLTLSAVHPNRHQ